ncbi:EAL domain-containing protein [bacterium]|nr:EAL domain-containing protein [bacterium]MBU1994679.1 EAL domain-containing protein [bacterium]
MPFSLLDINEHNAELLSLLTQHLPDMLWVKDTNGNYIYANNALCEGLLMAKDTQEPIGKNDIFFALRERATHSNNPYWHTFGELCFNSDRIVILNNKPMKFEEFGNIKGKMFYLEVYKAPFYDKDGNIIGTVGTGRDITELKKIQIDLQESLKKLDEQKEMFEYQANHDSLTDLPNRALFLDRLQQSIHMARRLRSKVAVIFMDLDHFKEINDSLGHHIGDKLLIEFSNRIKNVVRRSDTLSRLGGDEFCIILNDIADIDFISKFISQCMELNKLAYEIDKNSLHIGMSVGVSIYPSDGEQAGVLLQHADVAMYKAKSDGRNTYCFYDEEMTEKVFERANFENSLREAIDNKEFVVYFQPQINAKENTLVGMEALVRWQHPVIGLMSPEKFITLAEETGMIVQIDRLVMEQALCHFQKWHEDGLNPGKLAINLAVKQLQEDDFIDFITNLIKNKECIAQCLELEVTENNIMKNPGKSIEVMQQISELGIGLTIDDFGTGYSSLAYLKRLPINKLKIDKSFVSALPLNLDDIEISKTIISLSTILSLKVIAQGVETKEQKDFLVAHGCDFIQGYFYAHPMTAHDMTQFLIDYIKIDAP